MTPDERRRALAFNAVGPAVNDAGYWLPLSARKAVAEAVLEAIEDEPAEHCGDLVDGLTGGWLECVLRPGHQGSHADHGDTRWTVKPAAGPTADEYAASQRRAVRIQRLLDEQRDRIRKLHRNDGGLCTECSTEERGALWPCNTIAAIEPPRETTP